MHAGQGHVVADEVDEAVAGSASCELVLDRLDGENVGLPHGVEGLHDKLLVHVILQTSDPQCSFSTHFDFVLEIYLQTDPGQ